MNTLCKGFYANAEMGEGETCWFIGQRGTSLDMGADMSLIFLNGKRVFHRLDVPMHVMFFLPYEVEPGVVDGV